MSRVKPKPASSEQRYSIGKTQPGIRSSTIGPSARHDQEVSSTITPLDRGVLGVKPIPHKRTTPKSSAASPGKQRTGPSRAVPGGGQRPSETVAQARRPTVRDQRMSPSANADKTWGVTVELGPSRTDPLRSNNLATGPTATSLPVSSRERAP